MRRKTDSRWNFYIRENVPGYPSLYAVDETADNAREVFVGRIRKDGGLRVSRYFVKLAPEYGKSLLGEFRFDEERNVLVEVVVEPTFAKKNARSGGRSFDSAESEEDFPEMREFGMTYVADYAARTSGLVADLESTFSWTSPEGIYDLALSAFDSRYVSASSLETWQILKILPSGKKPFPFDEYAVEGILEDIGPYSIEHFYERRRARFARKRGRAVSEPSVVVFDLVIREHVSDFSRFSSARSPEYPEGYEPDENEDGWYRKSARALFCDRKTGAVLYVRDYKGTLGDARSFEEIFRAADEAGFSPDDLLIVTARTTEAVRQLEAKRPDVHILQWVTSDQHADPENPEWAVFEACRAELENPDTLRAEIAMKLVTEKRDPIPAAESEAGSNATPERPEYIHAYREPGVYETEQEELTKRVDRYLADLREGKDVSPFDEAWFGRYVRKVPVEASGKSAKKSKSFRWEVDDEALGATLRSVRLRIGFVVLRTRSVADPVDAFELHKLWFAATDDFGDYVLRTRACEFDLTEVDRTWRARAFIATLAVSMRMTLRWRLAASFLEEPELRRPYMEEDWELGPRQDLLDVVLGPLPYLKAVKRPSERYFTVEELTPKQSRVLKLLRVPVPARVLL